jgi:hypothetical protein
MKKAALYQLMKRKGDLAAGRRGPRNSLSRIMLNASSSRRLITMPKLLKGSDRRKSKSSWRANSSYLVT